MQDFRVCMGWDVLDSYWEAEVQVGRNLLACDSSCERSTTFYDGSQQFRRVTAGTMRVAIASATRS